MDKPQVQDAPGLAWRPRKGGWAAVWVARQDLVLKGYRPSTRQLGIFTEPLTEEQETKIRTACVAHQEDMYGLKPSGPVKLVKELIRAYRHDEASPIHATRYKSRLHVQSMLKRIGDKHGDDVLANLGARDMKAWYKDARFPDGEDGRELISTAHKVMTVVRMIFSFGDTFEVEKMPRHLLNNCARLRKVLSDLEFENPKARTEAMTLRQCEDIIAAANAKGMHSIALAQALQFDLRCRQKDIIGEWVPLSEPGLSRAPVYHGRKWLRGIVWEEISANLILHHPLSKSRTGKVLERDLSIYPMVMAELERIPAELRKGPVVICDHEGTAKGRPWKSNWFRQKWRECATAAGVPAGVWNMDSRAGGITETIEATGGNIEAARKEAEHSDIRTTQRYSRRKAEAVKEATVLVRDFRAKNRA